MSKINILKLNSSSLLKYYIFFISGLFASFSLPPINLFPFIFFLSLPIFFLIKCRNWKEASIIGFLSAFGWFVFSLYWLSNALIVSGGMYLWIVPLVFFGLPAFLSLFWGVAFFLTFVLGKSVIEKLLFLILLLPFFEWLRGTIFSGFPWNMIGFSLNNPLEISQTISILGPYGQNTLIVVLISIPVSLFLNKKIFTFFTLLFCFFIFSFSFYKLKTNELKLTENWVRIVQPNFSHTEKWDKNKFYENLNELMRLSEKKDITNFVIWPETAIVNFQENINQELQIITKSIFRGEEGFLITGMPRKEYIENKKHYFNSMYVFNNLGEVVSVYDKIKLVPFGEFNPFKNILSFFGTIASNQEFSKGKFTDSFFNFGDLNFLPLICYEAIFPSKIKYLNHYDVIINITNDYWFGNTFGPHQHHSLAKQRAIETGIPVLRVSNSGISSIIGPNGKELKKLDYDKKGFIDFRVPEKFEPTLYLMYGEKIYYYISIILILLIIFIRSQVSKLNFIKEKK